MLNFIHSDSQLTQNARWGDDHTQIEQCISRDAAGIFLSWNRVVESIFVPFFLFLVHNHNEHNSCWIYFVAFYVCWLFVLTLQRNETRNGGWDPCLRVCCRFIARIHLHIPFYFRTFMHHFIQLSQHHDRICHANRTFAGMREKERSFAPCIRDLLPMVLLLLSFDNADARTWTPKSVAPVKLFGIRSAHTSTFSPYFFLCDRFATERSMRINKCASSSSCTAHENGTTIK